MKVPNGSTRATARCSEWLGHFFIFLAHLHRLNQVSGGNQAKTQDSADQIEIMANAIFGSPAHPRKETKCLEHVSKNNDDQTCCAEELQKGGDTLSFQPNDH